VKAVVGRGCGRKRKRSTEKIVQAEGDEEWNVWQGRPKAERRGVREQSKLNNVESDGEINRVAQRFRGDRDLPERRTTCHVETQGLKQ
jgi:hypothetical protein